MHVIATEITYNLSPRTSRIDKLGKEIFKPFYAFMSCRLLLAVSHKSEGSLTVSQNNKKPLDYGLR